MGSVEAEDRVFKAIANADRRTILDAMRDQPLTTSDVCETLPYLDRTTVMLHLRVLEEADLVIVRRQGRYRWNYLNVSPIQDIYNRWIKAYAVPAAELLTRLKHDLEDVGETETSATHSV